ncbi:hypothetical protein PENSPDRAFT_681690 [Peniophora sp. CONT]|nr:hypothetical protein PENSPDRAFT_681690 [Peniophora sp. CONT]
MVATTRSRSLRTPPVSSSGSNPRKQTSPRMSTARATTKRTKSSSLQTPPKKRAKQVQPDKQPGVRSTRTKQKLPSEFLFGPSGYALIDQLTGYPVLSKFGKRVFDERRRRVAMPMLHFGLACNMCDILACADRRGYLTRPLDDPFREADGKDCVETYFRFRQIDCTFERILSNEHEFVVALYSNYDQFERQLIEEDENACLRMIRTELDLGDQQPMWHWDNIKSGSHYTAPLAEYNVPNLHKITVPVEDDD